MNSAELYSDKVFIGIPTYDRPENLRSVVENILSQSYKNITVFISDNASPGIHTRKVAEELMKKDNRVRYYRQTRNIGMAENFKYLLNNCTENYFMWKSDDDLIHDKDFVLKLYLKLKEGNFDFVFPDCIYHPETNKSDFSLNTIYKNCKSRFDYLNSITKSFSSLEFYGMYSLKQVNKGDLYFNNKSSCPDIYMVPYVFLNYNVCFVPEVNYQFYHIPSREGFIRNLNVNRDRFMELERLLTAIDKSSKLTGLEKEVLSKNIITYMSNMQEFEKSFSFKSRILIQLKNRIRLLFGLAKS